MNDLLNNIGPNNIHFILSWNITAQTRRLKQGILIVKEQQFKLPRVCRNIPFQSEKKV